MKKTADVMLNSGYHRTEQWRTAFMTHVWTMDCSCIFFSTNPVNRCLYCGCFVRALPVICYVLLLPSICNFQESEEFSLLHCTHQLGLLVKVLISHIRNIRKEKKIMFIFWELWYILCEGGQKDTVTVISELKPMSSNSPF